ncbi:hypothetical protein F4604DRAFT_1693021 [Suillus subluteus]|nr:hypothetical protein F4604DRAFT_1693021 [Suillus subluteus]
MNTGKWKHLSTIMQLTAKTWQLLAEVALKVYQTSVRDSACSPDHENCDHANYDENGAEADNTDTQHNNGHEDDEGDVATVGQDDLALSVTHTQVIFCQMTDLVGAFLLWKYQGVQMSDIPGSIFHVTSVNITRYNNFTECYGSKESKDPLSEADQPWGMAMKAHVGKQSVEQDAKLSELRCKTNIKGLELNRKCSKYIMKRDIPRDWLDNGWMLLDAVRCRVPKRKKVSKACTQECCALCGKVDMGRTWEDSVPMGQDAQPKCKMTKMAAKTHTSLSSKQKQTQVRKWTRAGKSGQEQAKVNKSKQEQTRVRSAGKSSK